MNSVYTKHSPTLGRSPGTVDLGRLPLMRNPGVRVELRRGIRRVDVGTLQLICIVVIIFSQGSMSRGQPGDGDPGTGAGDIVQSCIVTEPNGSRMPAVFTTDSDL
jgi:hypothetical protein